MIIAKCYLRLCQFMLETLGPMNLRLASSSGYAHGAIHKFILYQQKYDSRRSSHSRARNANLWFAISIIISPKTQLPGKLTVYWFNTLLHLDSAKKTKLYRFPANIKSLSFSLQLFTTLCSINSNRGHLFQLPEYTTDLHKKSFIIRTLYKYV